MRYFLGLLLILFLKAAAMVYAILYADIGLGPDEAQYWTWSHALDVGYYSKPPGIAWQIGLGTYFFGDTELGVRIISVVIAFFVPILIYLLAQACQLTPRTCFWSSAAMALSPIGMFSSFLAITDGGMILFWTAACAYVVLKISRHEIPSYPLLGLLILGGALFKWPIYFLWIAIIGSWIIFPWLASWRVILGIVISLGGLLPSVYWNSTHDWATFRHVFSTVSGGHGKSAAGTLLQGNFFEFLGSQTILFSPILFVLLLMAFWRMIRTRKQAPSGVLFCGSLSLIILISGLIASFVMKMQGNWIVFAYPTAFIVLGWYCCEEMKTGVAWLMGGIVLAVVACCLIFILPKIQRGDIPLGLKIPYKISPFRHNVGWDHLSQVLEEVGYHPDQDFLFGDKYQTASILSFYSEGQKRAYFFNLQGMRKNQFSYWPGMQIEQKGKRGFFVAVENIPQLNNSEQVGKYTRQLKPYFDRVHFLGMKPLYNAYGEVVKGALIFEGTGYNGQAPIDPDLY